MTVQFHLPRWLLIVLALTAAFTLGALSAGALNMGQPSAVSFGSGFTYQGFLRDSGGTPISDSCNLTFRLYDDLSAGSQVGSDDVITGVPIDNGLFTVLLNDANEFGSAAFNGGGRFLEIAIQCSGDPSPTTLSPRQPISPVPYALFAERFAGYENLIVVAKQGGDFASVVEAVDAIGVDPVYPAASPTNRYLIYVAPGIYDEGQIVMKEYVDIEGAGQGVTVLTMEGGSPAGIVPGSAKLVGASSAEVRHLTVENRSSDPTNWTFAIYAAGNTRFTHVTAQAFDGSYPRAMMVHNGGSPILKDVTLITSGGSISNTALDIFQATALADGLFVTATGGTFAHGIYVNTASSPVNLENVTAFVFDGSDQTNGLYLLQSEVHLTAYDTRVSSSGSSTQGIYCTSLDSRLTARDVVIDASGGSPAGVTRGILATNCDLTLSTARAAVSSPGAVYGLFYNSSVTNTKTLEINQLDIQADSSQDFVSGLYVNSNSDSSTGATGRVNDVTIRAFGNITTSNSYGLLHNSHGDFLYQDLVVDLGGAASYLYGIRVDNGGNPVFQNVRAFVQGEAFTVIGAEFWTTARGGSIESGIFKAVQTGDGGDAVGLKTSSGGAFFNLRQISSEAVAPTLAIAYHLENGVVFGSDLVGSATGRNPANSVEGLRCGFNANAILNLNDVVLNAGTETTDFDAGAMYGIRAINCDLTLRNAVLNASAFDGINYGLIMSGGPISLYNVDSQAYGEPALSSAFNYGISIVSSPAAFLSQVRAMAQGPGGNNYGLRLFANSTGPSQTAYVDNSEMSGSTAALYVQNDSTVYVTNSLLTGGATLLSASAGTSPAAECTAVSYDDPAPPYTFLAGPAACP